MSIGSHYGGRGSSGGHEGKVKCHIVIQMIFVLVNYAFLKSYVVVKNFHMNLELVRFIERSYKKNNTFSA